VPLISEAGLPGYESSVWFGIVMPAGTPQPIVARVAADIARGVQQPEIRDRLTNMGYEVTSTTPEQMAAMIRAEIPKWARVVKAAGVRVD
jgi:tripartite-type tricarboxylate transporter receptor subunit TctC